METITIEKSYYEFLLEKAKERCQLYSENRYLRYKLNVETMDKEQWKLYRDFIYHRWHPLTKEEYKDEVELAEIMIRRTENQEKALDRFYDMTAERNRLTKKEK